ncbi:MAG: Ig-like domain-containing protein [Eubacterium sp.]|nr:Ig-like domain-containing protein [Eubacterium sp.]
MKNKFLAVLLVFALAFGIGTPAAPSEAASFPVTSLKLRVGSIYTLRPTGLLGVPTWSSSKKYVASVTQSGIITAKDPGTTTIKAKAGKTTLSCKVTVKKKSKKKGGKYNPKSLPSNKNKGYDFTFYMEEKKVGSFNIQIERFAYGEESARMALNNTSNPKPLSTQQYLFFSVRLKYKSGTQTIRMSNVFNYFKNIYGAYGAKQLVPIDYGYGFGSHENISTVNISPGNTITADVAVLVEKGFTPVTFRLQTGPTSYTWIKL